MGPRRFFDLVSTIQDLTKEAEEIQKQEAAQTGKPATFESKELSSTITDAQPIPEPIN